MLNSSQNISSYQQDKIEAGSHSLFCKAWVTMNKSTNLFLITSLFGIAILVGVGVYLYQVRQSFQEFESHFQHSVSLFKKQAVNPSTIIDLQIKEVELSGDYERIEHLMTKYFKRSLSFENRYREKKNQLKLNELFTVAYLQQDPTLIQAEVTLNQVDLLFVEMYREKSEMFDQLLIDANQIELSTHNKTNHFHQNFDQFFTQYVKTQEQILNLEKKNLAVRREMLRLLKENAWTIENGQLQFEDPAKLSQFQAMQKGIQQTHAQKIAMQERALALFLTLYS